MSSPDSTPLTSDERGDLIDVVYGALLSNHLIGNVLIPVVERILVARTAAARADERRKVAEEIATHWACHDTDCDDTACVVANNIVDHLRAHAEGEPQ